MAEKKTGGVFKKVGDKLVRNEAVPQTKPKADAINEKALADMAKAEKNPGEQAAAKPAARPGPAAAVENQEGE